MPSSPIALRTSCWGSRPWQGVSSTTADALCFHLRAMTSPKIFLTTTKKEPRIKRVPIIYSTHTHTHTYIYNITVMLTKEL
jgi:hypothetical protein